MPPTMLKPAPVTVAWEIVTVAVPVLVKVSVCGLVDPSTTFQKLRLVELAEKVPEEVAFEFDFEGDFCFPAPVRPTQPEIDSTARDARIKVIRPIGARRLSAV